jgi:hypothetical protein
MKYSEIRRVILIFLSFILIGLLAVLVAINKDLIGLAIFFIILVALIFKIIETLMVKCNHCKNRPLSLLKNFPDICPHCGKKL